MGKSSLRVQTMSHLQAGGIRCGRLTFALLGVATPADLIADKSRTPFNIERAIQLQGFSLSEAMPLLPGLYQLSSNPKVLLREILTWTGGQLFLTQKLCQLVVQSKYAKIGESEIGEWVEGLVRNLIIDNWEAHDEPEHLKTIRDRLLHNEQQAGRLLELYQQILLHSSAGSDGELDAGIPVNNSQEQTQLLLSGLRPLVQLSCLTINSIELQHSTKTIIQVALQSCFMKLAML
nr:hypothetical protein [Nostoc sp. CmiSLP01]MDZ8287065.1 hypothetical protein [Nostoc sp. ChiSLP01]